MNGNHSPWIQQLKRTRPLDQIQTDTVADVVVVGGGIAGVSTAYFILKHTNRNVLLVEAGKVAHGATGHNAGQMVSYFEKQLIGIAETFGVELATEGQRDIDSAWDLLQSIYTDLQLETAMYQFLGFAGITDVDEILTHLKNSAVSQAYGLNVERLMIAEGSEALAHIPKEYDGLYTVLPITDIQALLETKNPQYIAALEGRKGCMNSALFTEEVVGALLSTYPDRFSLFEESPVADILLEKEVALLHVKEYKVTAQKVVLCTNGFEKFSITNHAGKDIDTGFHENVSGTIGYMSAYVDERDRPPIALSYINTNNSADPYFYLTRRPFEGEHNQKHNLICVGGPELNIEDTKLYSKTEHVYPDDAIAGIDTFLHTTYKHAPRDTITYKYQWHGLMGYTPNGVRVIGEEPCNPILMYNLGCNGVGILPSVFGGNKIARIINGEKMKPSIFDPRISGMHCASISQEL